MALTKETLVSVSKTNDFKSVRALKLDTMELTSCFKLLLQEFGVNLYMLTLKNNALTEIDINLGFTNLRKLDLSTNFITSAGGKDLWTTMPRLQVLYLHDNLLETWESFYSLTSLPAILHLTLFNNPCIHLNDYRKIMINALPKLLALDFHVATQEERLGLMPCDPEKAKIWIQDTNDHRNFKQHVYKLKRKWEKCSPAIKIQSLWRRYWVRKDIRGHLSERDKQAVFIQKHIRGWLLRKKLKKDLEKLLKDTNMEHLLYSTEEFLHFKAVKKIEKWYKVYKARKDLIRRRHKASTRISACYKKWRTCQFSTDFLTHSKIYLLKSHQRPLICMLRAMAKYDPEVYHPANTIKDRLAPEFFENLEKIDSEYTFAELFERITDCRNIKVVRFPDTDNMPYSNIPLIQLVKWAKDSKILNSWEKKPISGVSISKKFCSAAEYEVLKKFKNRGSSISAKERKDIAEIDLHLDDYLDLFEFNAPNLSFLHNLLQLVLQYNKVLNQKNLPIFIPIYEVLLDRVKAVCTVQACWRGYKVRKHCNIAKLAIRRRAAYSIQHWWRMQNFNYRMSSLYKLKSILSEFTSTTVYLQEHLFQYLFPSQSRYTFAEQNFEYFCKGDTVYLSQCPRSNYKLLPDWVGAQVTADRIGITPSDEEKTLQAIILSGARVDIVPLYSQVSDAKIADPNLKFLKLEFRSLDEVKKRVSILFLQTLQHRNRSFIPLLTISHLAHPFLMSKLRAVWASRGINYLDPCPALQILEKALSPIDTIMNITPTPIPPLLKAGVSEKVIETMEHVEVPVRNTISSQELLRKRVQRAREENLRRNIESKMSKRMELEQKAEETREVKEQNLEFLAVRHDSELREVQLRRNMIMAQSRKKQEVVNERKFIVQFAQAKNMLQKLTKNSDIDRWRNKSRQDIREKVLNFKQKSQERKEFVRSMLYEKYKRKGSKTVIL